MQRFVGVVSFVGPSKDSLDGIDSKKQLLRFLLFLITFAITDETIQRTNEIALMCLNILSGR